MCTRGVRYVHGKSGRITRTTREEERILGWKENTLRCVLISSRLGECFGARDKSKR